MSGERLARIGLLSVGLVLAMFGLWSLLRIGLANLLNTVLWLAAVVVAHDLLLSAVTIWAVWLGIRLLPPWARGPAAAGLVVLASVSIMAIPVLGRFGARPDNPSLLDRSYGLGWLAFAGIVAVGVTAAAGFAHHREVARVDGEHG